MYYSACMEVSEHSSEGDRVHLHLYLSWHKAGAHGIDHQTTNEWVFNGVRPRVDSNTEARSPWQWLRATHHGHWSSVGLLEVEVFEILRKHRRCKSWALNRGDAYIHFMLHFLTPSPFEYGPSLGKLCTLYIHWLIWLKLFLWMQNNCTHHFASKLRLSNFVLFSLCNLSR